MTKQEHCCSTQFTFILAEILAQVAAMMVNLPIEIEELMRAVNALQRRYSEYGLRFTPDGKLVGDIGEAVAAESFGVRLVQGHGIDGYAPDGRSVQVKASGTGGGAAYRNVKTVADVLLFFHFDFAALTAVVLYNGPEARVRATLPVDFKDQRVVGVPKLRALNLGVLDAERLHLRPMKRSVS